MIINPERFRVLSDTNGKVYVALDFGITHVFRRAESADSMARAYTYILPWLKLTTAWSNTTLNGLAISVDPVDQQVTKIVESGMVIMGLVTRICVYTEFNIDVSP